MNQPQLFGPKLERVPQPPADGERELEVLVTVKAAPNPSTNYGETVCVAGVSADIAKPEWVRLYPINFRYLQQEVRFSKYDVIRLRARPARNDPRAESWRPNMDSLSVVRKIPPWKRRRPWLDPYVENSMCELNRAARDDAHARSLGLVRVADVDGLDVEAHPGWTKQEQAKIDSYVGQLDLLKNDDRTALEAPRFRGYYKWRCADTACKGHRQGMIDWEFVALQRNLTSATDGELSDALQRKFVDQICGPANDVSFYVGNQAKHAHVFSVLGVYYPKLTS